MLLEVAHEERVMASPHHNHTEKTGIKSQLYKLVDGGPMRFTLSSKTNKFRPVKYAVHTKGAGSSSSTMPSSPAQKPPSTRTVLPAPPLPPSAAKKPALRQPASSSPAEPESSSAGNESAPPQAGPSSAKEPAPSQAGPSTSIKRSSSVQNRLLKLPSDFVSQYPLPQLPDIAFGQSGLRDLAYDWSGESVLGAFREIDAAEYVPEVEDKAPAVEEKPPTVEEKSPAVADKPSTVGDKAPVAEEKPPAADDKPSVAEKDKPPFVAASAVSLNEDSISVEKILAEIMSGNFQPEESVAPETEVRYASGGDTSSEYSTTRESTPKEGKSAQTTPEDSVGDRNSGLEREGEGEGEGENNTAELEADATSVTASKASAAAPHVGDDKGEEDITLYPPGEPGPSREHSHTERSST